MPAHPEYPWKWQVGVGYSVLHPDYTPRKSLDSTGSIYGDYQFLPNFGLDNRVHISSTNAGVKEITFMSGPRLSLPLHRVSPYISGMIGYGHFSYTQAGVLIYANNSFTIDYATGIDIRVTKHINVRPVDLEYQRWVNFLPNGLTPTLYTAGISYHR